MATTKVSDLNSLFAEIYEDAIYVARERALMPSLVTNYVARGMQDRNLGIYPTITAQTKAEGVDYATPTTFTKTSKMAITPAVAMAQVILTDERINTDPDDAQRDAAQEMGNALATKIDTDLCDLFNDLTTNTGKGTANSSVTIKMAAAAIAVLRNAMAPNPLYAVLHPYHWFDLWVELGNPAATYDFLGETANQAMRDYAVGAWIGAQWFQDANIDVDADDDAYSGFFHREALALDTREAISAETERDASKKAWEINMSAAYGVGVRRAEWGVYLLGDATTPTGG
jgi:hypothetical protein